MDTAKELLFGEDVRLALFEGVKVAYQAVKHTYGSHTRNTILDSSGGIEISRGAYSTLEDFSVKDSKINAGIDIVKESVMKMKTEFGDGTTLTVILIFHLYQKILHYIAAGYDPITIKKSLDSNLQEVKEKLTSMRREITSDEDIYQIALASSGGDSTIATNILTAIKMVGKDGIITIEESKTSETTLFSEQGIKIDRGLLSPYFATNPDTMEAEISDVRIFITEEKITSPQEILPLLHESALSKKPLLIIADDFEGETLPTFIVNKLKGMANIFAIKAPGFGDQRRELLEDLAVAVGGVVVSEKKGMSLKGSRSDVLGKADRVIIKKDETLIINGKGSVTSIKSKISEIESRIKTSDNKYDLERLIKRKASLTGGVAVISIGGHTEFEIKERKKKQEVSLSAVQSALKSGVLPGGGSSLLFASLGISKAKTDIGADILKSALSYPFTILLENAGIDPTNIKVEILKKGHPFGLNLTTQKIENLHDGGVIDSFDVIINALLHAVSAALLLARSETLILNLEEEKKH